MINFNPQHSLDEQLQQLKEAIRKNPEKASLRIYYFQLLVIYGEWQKSLDQLQICAQLDASATAMARAYREIIRCEVFRSEVFLGNKTPNILGEPPEWLGWLVDATKRLAQNDESGAFELSARAFEVAPATAGKINDTSFEWLADSDSRLGPICELYANGNYYWIPFSSIQKINFEKPQDLRDLVWATCEVTLINGGVMLGFIPTRYPDSQNSKEDGIRLARTTKWQELAEDYAVGVGQRVWITDHSDIALLDVRRVSFAT